MSTKKVCVVCGKTYLGTGKTKTCSRECGEIRRRQLQKIYHDTHPQKKKAPIDYSDIERRKTSRKELVKEVKRLNEIGISYGKAHAPKVEVIVPAWAK